GPAGQAPVLEHPGVQEILVDGRQLEFELRVQVRDDLLVALHGIGQTSNQLSGAHATSLCPGKGQAGMGQVLQTRTIRIRIQPWSSASARTSRNGTSPRRWPVVATALLHCKKSSRWRPAAAPVNAWPARPSPSTRAPASARWPPPDAQAPDSETPPEGGVFICITAFWQ